jgi:hypothetical protein
LGSHCCALGTLREQRFRFFRHGIRPQNKSELLIYNFQGNRNLPGDIV